MKYIKTFEEVEKWKLSWLKEDSTRKFGEKFLPYEISEYVTSFHKSDDYDDTDTDDRINDYDYFILEKLSINLLDLDEWELDDDKVKQYINDYKEVGDYPAIVVGKLDDVNYTIIDGLHRLNAINEIGEKTIKAYVGYK